jgi:hypothetical protein
MDIGAETKQRTQPSLEAHQVAMQYQMGGLIAEYRKRQATQKEKWTRRIVWPLLIFLYLCMIGLLIFLILIAIYNLNSFMQFLSLSFINILAFIGFALFFLLMYGLLFIGIPLSFYRKRNPYILHCTEGLICNRGGRAITMHWDEIESVSESIWAASGSGYTCLLRLHGKKYAFDGNVESARELGRTIEREITRRRIDSYWQQTKQGEELRFGPLCISQEGMYKRLDLVPWDQISQVHIYQGVIVIAKDGVPQKWPLVRVARIPNFFLFVALIHLLTNGRVSYQPLEFEYKDYLLELMRLLFRQKAK